MALCNQQTRQGLFEIPRQVELWAEDYASQLSEDHAYNIMLVADFESEIDNLAIAALACGFKQGILTVEEYSYLGGKVWDTWARFHNVAIYYKGKESWLRRLIRRVFGTS
jgi:hypothetical protein